MKYKKKYFFISIRCIYTYFSKWNWHSNSSEKDLFHLEFYWLCIFLGRKRKLNKGRSNQCTILNTRGIHIIFWTNFTFSANGSENLYYVPETMVDLRGTEEIKMVCWWNLLSVRDLANNCTNNNIISLRNLSRLRRI